MIHILKSKLQQVLVTGCSEDYEGSITLDPDLMRAANIQPFEQVHVNNKETGYRLITYVIEGIKGSGQVDINGAAAHHFSVGDRIHVITYQSVFESGSLLKEAIQIVKTDPQNKPL